MSRISLIRELERQIEESRQNFREGKGIPLKDFDLGLPTPFIIAEASGNKSQNN